MDKNFYVYVFLREDLVSPYYVGKGKGKRCYKNDGRTFPRPKDRNRIRIIKDNLTEEESFILEKLLILQWGRQDNGTGVLRNLTDGGEGMSGHKPSEETNRIRSEKIRKFWEGRERKGWNKGVPMTEERKQNLREKMTGRKNPEHSERMKGNKNSQGKRKPLSEEHKEKIRLGCQKSSKNRLRGEDGKFIPKK
tara:strand:- start:345 stop:923 length:579 start_codon:yes stop_codon:yes gene_type:complete